MSGRCRIEGCCRWVAVGSHGEETSGLCSQHFKVERKRLRSSELSEMLNRQAFSAIELDSLPWEEAAWVHRLHGGDHSTGVFVVQLRNKLLVLKPGSVYSPGELFCARLYQKLGIRAPRQRLVQRDDDGEFERLFAAIAGDSCKYIDIGEKQNILHYLRGPYCTVSEYCPSVSLYDLATVCGSVDAPGKPPFVHSFLFELGVVIAADILCNNGDRTPSIHQDRRHRGNPGNIMISTTKPYVVAVDNTTTGIRDAAGCARYLDCVGDIASQIFDPTIDLSDIAQLSAVSEFLLVHTGIDVGIDGRSSVAEGVAEGIHRISTALLTNSLVFGEIKRDVMDDFGVPVHISSRGLLRPAKLPPSPPENQQHHQQQQEAEYWERRQQQDQQQQGDYYEMLGFSKTMSNSKELAWIGLQLIDIVCIKKAAQRMHQALALHTGTLR